jgi:signal recognition particle subunit SEC65
VRANFKRRKGVQLSPEELRAMVNGQWERSISAETDRLGIHIIEAMCYEKVNPQVAVSGYRFVVDQAKEIRHLMLLVPAYLRLTQLLIRSGEAAEALELVERFEARFPTNKRGPHFPSEEQREMMRTKKTQLLKGLPLKMPA